MRHFECSVYERLCLEAHTKGIPWSHPDIVQSVKSQLIQTRDTQLSKGVALDKIISKQPNREWTYATI